MMVYVWLRPFSVLSRGKILFLLDAVGKWSLADNFVLMILVTFFHVEWSGPDVTGTGFAEIQLKCLTEMETGAFLTATMASLVLGHTMLAIHRISTGHFSKAEGLAGSERSALWRGAAPGKRPIIRAALAVGTALALLVELGLVLAAWHTPMVMVELDGIVGSVLDVTGQSRQHRYSLSNIASHLGHQGSIDLSAALTVFAMALPALAIVALLLLWIVPLTGRARFVVLTACQTLVAWSSLDVVVVALLGAVLGGEAYGIGKFLDMIIYTQNVAPLCKSLRDNFSVACFDMHLEFSDGFFVLFGAAAMHVIVTQTALRTMCTSHMNICAL
eukprot:gnl/TRDRNA2_/TRDRNA2_27432_c0_seq1.p1 gnl/TRDRNA2_/TRDRNA2_27432_c0~~gnl/TRDRNA2_/TRDRNA2_27432_c0_seq1.p1  ORF type:complete len:373 (-),score=38.08 gnl/TRDRNA2_/TRDRNA2_27432_c0_seq1:384-1373(-)